jgi:hypothetical protein
MRSQLRRERGAPGFSALRRVILGVGNGVIRRAGAILVLSAAAVGAQPWAVRQVSLTVAGADVDRCAAEVEVDGAAEIEIEALQGRMRSLAGAEPVWIRLECATALPPAARQFRFRALQGRGAQYLVREPRENRGVAVIRIEDPQAGQARYAFELAWNGSGGLISPAAGLAGGGLESAGLAAAATEGWKGQIRFQGKGDGFYRTFHAADALLAECSVDVDPGGRVRVEFQTNQRYRLTLSGRLVRAGRDRLVAAVNGSGVGGTMELSLDRRGRVREISMSGAGRNRFELRWSAK